jgi:nascent polypeptide-associated complex subunit alpha
MQRRFNPREARRMMKRMGVEMTQVSDVQQVIVQTSTKEIIIESPEVAVLDLQGQKIFQVTGNRITEKNLEKEISAPKEDIQLVANQTGRSLEEAERALEETQGDLAKAILLLQS